MSISASVALRNVKSMSAAVKDQRMKLWSVSARGVIVRTDELGKGGVDVEERSQRGMML